MKKKRPKIGTWSWDMKYGYRTYDENGKQDSGKREEPLLSKIHWWVFYQKIKFEYWLSIRRDKRMRRKYCHRGLHKLIPCSHQFTNEKGTQRVEYLGCAFCEYKFFATQRSMNKYKLLTESWARRTTSAFSRMPSIPKRDGHKVLVASKREKSLPDRKVRRNGLRRPNSHRRRQ